MHNQYRSYYKPYSANQNPSYSPGQRPVHPYYGQGADFMNGPNYLEYANPQMPNSNSYLHLNQNSGRNYGLRYPQFQPQVAQQTLATSINPSVSVSSNSSSNPYKAPISVSSSTPTSTTTVTNNSTSTSTSSIQPSSDEARLAVLRAVISRSQKRLNEIEQQKKLLEDEERRLKQSFSEKKAEIEKIESRIGTGATGLSPSVASVTPVTSVNLSGVTRDPRLKNRILPHPSVGTTVSSSNLTVNNSSFNVDSTSLFSSNPSMSSTGTTNTTPSYVPSNSTLSSLLAVPSSSTTPVITSSSLFTPTTSSQPSTSDPTQRVLNRSSAYQPPLFINSSSTTVVQSNPQRMLAPISASNSNSANVSSSSISSTSSYFPSSGATGNNSMPIQSSVFSALFGKKDGITKNNNSVNQSNKGKPANSVQFKSLPLVYDESTEDLMSPACFSEVRLKLSFKFNQAQLRSITDQSIGRRVLLRICVIKAKKSSQSDRVPRKLQIKVNGRLTSSSKNQQGTIKAPIDITTLVSTVYGANQEVELVWPDSEPVKEYGIGLFLAKRLSIEQTLAILLTKDYQRPRSETLKLIKQNYENTGDICSEEIMIPLICPITKQRLEFPCVGSKCGHLNCFDGKSFVNINRARTEWHCPSCKKPIGYNDLRIDELASQIISTTGADVTRVKFDTDGNWKPVSDSKNDSNCSNVIDDSRSQIDIITLDDSDDERSTSNQRQAPSTREAPRRREDVVLPPSPGQFINQMLHEIRDSHGDQCSSVNQSTDHEIEEEEEDDDDEEDDEEEEEDTTDTEQSDRSKTSRSEGEISDDDDEDPDFELDSSPNSNHRPKRAKLDDSTLDDEIRLPAKTRTRKKKTNAEIFGSDTDSGSPSPVSRKRRRQCTSSRGKRR
ncbi:uncharacterized protein LOC141851936 [Brevipalpus obovatus]|uniref:uncharacterized protein LOC141851936 n=1 Tax=Brevipalpus obovatus TaxID=246614 RepID=UPI003D9F803E